MPVTRSGRGWLTAIGVALLAAIALIATLRHQGLADEMMRADPDTILDQPRLAAAAIDLGRKGFVAHCAACHGRGGGDPARGIPDLTDADYLYGSGRVDEIEQIVLHGIRSGDPRGWRLASMPAYARAVPYAAEPIPPLTPGGIADVTQYLLHLRARDTDPAAAARGERLYRGNGGCWDCHSGDAGGDEAVGAPNLADDVWLYGDGSARSIADTLVHGRAGVSPAFARVLSPDDARAIAVYVASLARPTKKEPAR